MQGDGAAYGAFQYRDPLVAPEVSKLLPGRLGRKPPIAARSLSNVQFSSSSMCCKTLAPKRCQFVLLSHCIPCHEFNLGHHLHQSNSLRMIMSKTTASFRAPRCAQEQLKSTLKSLAYLLSRASIACYQPSQRFLFFATFLTHVWHPNLSWIC
jgi:hypothetical protein